jgi:hypothetical protein
MVGNIVGFTNSPNSPRNYSPVIKSIYRIVEANGNAKANGNSICIGGAFGAYYPLRNRIKMIYYSLLTKCLCFFAFATPPLSKRLCFASTDIISIFSIDVFWRTHFMAFGFIVGFTNSRNSPRNFSPVIKSMD